MARCTACGCHKTSKQVVFGEGSTSARIVVVGEGPGPDEDLQGRPFVGRAGKFLDKLLGEVGIERESVWISNTVKCFPGRVDGGFRKPSDEEVGVCVEKYLSRELAAIKPRVIIALGAVASKALTGLTLPMKAMIGKEYEHECGGLILPAYHPSYLIRNAEDAIARRQVIDVLVRAKNLANLSSAGEKHLDQTRVQSHHEDKRIIQQLEKSVLVASHPWHPEREYLNAWTDGTKVILLYRDDEGQRQHEVIDDFRWYFYMKTSEVIELGSGFWRPWMDDGLVTGFEVDDVNESWTKVHAVRHVTRTRALREHVLETAINLFDDSQISRFPHDQELRKLLDAIEAAGAKHYEADLTPFKRFVTDYDVHISTSMNETYFDIETDDTEPGFDRAKLPEKMILSLSWETHFADKSRKPDVGYIASRSATERHEKLMLQEFADSVLNLDSDVLYAWNGNGFDFPILRGRMHRYGIAVDWDHVHTVDLMRTWFRYFQRGATVNTSFSLQNIAMRVLKMGKVDWRLKARERGLKIDKIIDLYHRAPDILEEYNRDDTHKLVELEKFTGFAKIDQVFSRIGNCFARDYHITTKIDSLLLKRGKQVGEHFPTRRASILSHEKAREAHYEGAYVLNPVVGIHENVAAVDFKSLYPSVMVGWNMSPDTYVPPEEVKNHPPESLIECPTGATFRQDVQGFIPAVFEETLQKRKVYTNLQAQEEVGSDKFLLYYRLAYSFKRLGLCILGCSIVRVGDDRQWHFEPIEALWSSLLSTYNMEVPTHDQADGSHAHALHDSGEQIAQSKQTIREAKEMLGVVCEHSSSDATHLDLSQRGANSGRLLCLPHLRQQEVRSPGSPLARDEQGEHGRRQSEGATPWLSGLAHGGDQEAHRKEEQGILEYPGRDASSGALRRAAPPGENWHEAIAGDYREATEDHVEAREGQSAFLRRAPCFCQGKAREREAPRDQSIREDQGEDQRGRQGGLGERRGAATAAVLEADAWPGHVSGGAGEAAPGKARLHQDPPGVPREAPAGRDRSSCACSCRQRSRSQEVRICEILDVSRLGLLTEAVRADGTRVVSGIMKVIRHQLHAGDALFRIVLQSGADVTVTGDHSVMVWDGDQLVARLTTLLTIGDELSSARAGRDSIVAIEPVRSEPGAWVYDLEVEETATFVANGVVVHNSFYGDLGNDGSRYYNPRIAEAVTLSGQYLLKRTVELAKQRKYVPIYGDTDSLYIAMSESEGPEFVKWVNEELYAHLHERYGMPKSRFIVELEYENYFSRMFFVRKKRYAGLMTMYKGKTANFVEVKGFECMRSDGIERARQVQKTVIEMILRERASVKSIIEFIGREFAICVDGKLGKDDVTITKGITKSPSQYKSRIVHVELAKKLQAEHGSDFAVGMKIPFVMIPGDGKKPDGVLADEYEEGSYDRQHYWDKLIWPPTYRILCVVYPWVEWEKFFYKPPKERPSVKGVDDDSE